MTGLYIQITTISFTIPFLLQPRLGLPFGLLNPLLIRSVPFLQLRRSDTLQDFPSKANEIMPPQRVFPLPRTALLLFPIQPILISDRLRPYPEILHHDQQIETYLVGGVSFDAPLEDGYDLVGEVVERTGAVRYWCWLQAIELVQDAVDGRISDEMVDIILLRSNLLRFVDEGGGAGEGIVDVSYQFGVG